VTLVIGLTGGIGSGKSTVARLLADHGATVIDADAIARDIVQPGEPALLELIEYFGADIVDDAGNLRRARLAEIAFADEQATAALNAIMHPRIASRAQELIAANHSPVVVYDMPLLVETGQVSAVDRVVVVDIDPEIQMKRAQERGTLAVEDIERRRRIQASRDQRLAIADYVITNDGSVEDLQEQVAALWSVMIHDSASKRGRLS
jgi:dephospho-CoA kinase